MAYLNEEDVKVVVSRLGRVLEYYAEKNEPTSLSQLVHMTNGKCASPAECPFGQACGEVDFCPVIVHENQTV